MDKKITFRYLFEIIVIVFSVTLSFYIQEVLDDKEKEELKNDTLRGMLDDIKDTKASLDISEIYFDERIEKAEKIIETKKVTNEDILWIVSGWPWSVTETSYKSLIATGAVEYINNEGLYKEITQFYNQDILKIIGEEYTIEIRDFWKYLNKNYPIISMNKSKDYLAQGDWPTSLQFKYSKSSLNKMMQDKIFTNYVYRTISYATTMYFWNSTFQEKLPKLRESIKKEIDP